MQRRSAKKSRHGCRECKRRHVKCDETRPSCANCNVRHLPCSFLPTSSSLLPIPVRESASTSTAPSPAASRQSDGVAPLSPHSQHNQVELAAPLSLVRPTFSLAPAVSTDQTFKLHHLELLHNVKTGVLGHGLLNGSAVDRYVDMIVGQAIQAPYLMDQLLALSAANMSTKRPHQQCFYREEATLLQTRGLALFNAAQAATDSSLAAFVFSTLLSHQVLFDAFTTRTDFPSFLDKLVTAFHICGGVRTITGTSWHLIRTQYQLQTGINLHEYLADDGPETIFTTKLTQLKALFANANTSPSISSPCNTALRFLQDVAYGPPPDTPGYPAFRATRVIRWAVQIPTEFVKLLEQRRPEALIIIAYYALLIYDSRDCWVYGDAAPFIIRSITRFLGKYWAEWLAWPNEVVDSADYTDGVRLRSPIDISMQHRIDELP